MANFKNLKKIVNVNKPVFRLADPNNPVMYRSNPTSIGTPIQQQDQINDQTQTAIQQMRDILSKSAPVQNNNSVPNNEGPPLDDEQRVNDASDDLINNFDPDETLDRLDKLPEDISVRDRAAIQSRVLDAMRKSGKISYED